MDQRIVRRTDGHGAHLGLRRQSEVTQRRVADAARDLNDPAHPQLAIGGGADTRTRRLDTRALGGERARVLVIHRDQLVLAARRIGTPQHAAAVARVGDEHACWRAQGRKGGAPGLVGTETLHPARM